MNSKLLVFIFLIPTIIFGQPINLTSPEFGHVNDFLLDGSEIVIISRNGIYQQQLNNHNNEVLTSLAEKIEQPSRVRISHGQIYFTNNGELYRVEDIENKKISKLYSADAPILNFLVLDSKRIAIGTNNGEFSIIDFDDNEKKFTHQFPGFISCILANPEDESLIISDIKGNIKSISLSGQIKWSKNYKTPIFDLYLNEKSIFIGGLSSMQQLNRKDFSPTRKHKTPSWVTHVSGTSDFIAFGTTSGKVEVLGPFANHNYAFNSAIVKIESMPPKNGKIELIVLTKSGELMKLNGIDMKMKVH